MGKIRELAEKVGKWLDSWLFFGIAEEEDAKTHYIKCEKEFYQDVEEGYKPFEVRKNDRDYRAGDDIVLREYDKDLGVASNMKAKAIRCTSIIWASTWKETIGSIQTILGTMI